MNTAVCRHVWANRVGEKHSGVRGTWPGGGGHQGMMQKLETWRVSDSWPGSEGGDVRGQGGGVACAKALRHR